MPVKDIANVNSEICDENLSLYFRGINFFKILSSKIFLRCLKNLIGIIMRNYIFDVFLYVEKFEENLQIRFIKFLRGM